MKRTGLSHVCPHHAYKYNDPLDTVEASYHIKGIFLVIRLLAGVSG